DQAGGYPAHQSDAGRIDSRWGHGEDESSNPTKPPQGGVNNQPQAQAPAPTGQMAGAAHENDSPTIVVVQIAPGLHHSVIHPDSTTPNSGPAPLPPAGPEVDQRLTLPPVGTPVAPQAPVIVQQNVPVPP